MCSFESFPRRTQGYTASSQLVDAGETSTLPVPVGYSERRQQSVEAGALPVQLDRCAATLSAHTAVGCPPTATFGLCRPAAPPRGATTSNA